MLIDTHCHLNDEKLLCDIDRIVDDFDKDGIESAICVGYDMPSSELAVSICEKYDRVYAAVGVHPHDADTLDDAVCQRILELAKRQKVVAIGEIGLDYYYDLSEREVQNPLSQSKSNLQTRRNCRLRCTFATHTKILEKSFSICKSI